MKRKEIEEIEECMEMRLFDFVGFFDALDFFSEILEHHSPFLYIWLA